MQIACVLSAVRISPTVAISSRARELIAQGQDIIALAAGEPDFNTPDNICQAAICAIGQGYTRYTAVEGIGELRTAICDKFKRDNDLSYNTDQIIVSTGGKQVIFNALMATLNQGDEVVIAAPYWVSYPDIVLLCGAKPVIVATQMADNFRLNAAQLAQVITPKTRWLILNSPSNPTGSMYSAADLEALAQVLIHHPQVMVLSDDIYEKLSYGDVDFASIAALSPQLYDRTLSVNGVSKAYAMTGWRIGYGAGPAKLIAAMKKLQGQSTSGACSIAQMAAVEALNGSQATLDVMLEKFKSRRDSVVMKLNAIQGLESNLPDGAFYVFCSIEALMGKTSRTGMRIENDVDWAMALMQEQGVCIVPGSAFGYEGFFRLSFAASDEALAKACSRIEKFVQDLI